MKREFVHIIIYIAAISVWLAGWQADAQTFTIRSVIAEREAQAAADSSLDWPDHLQARLSELVCNPMFEHSQLGLYVYDLTADSALFEQGKRQLLRPASTQKLLTAITALAQLGGSYRFETSIYRTGELADSVLHGDLYVVGGFDPRFGYDDLRAMVDKLASSGVRRIDGRLFLDVSMKDTLAWGWGWCWDDELAPLSPLTVNGHDDFSAALFRALGSVGISFVGATENAVRPAGAVLVASRHHSMDQILTEALKESNNHYAEALFYQLGAQDGMAYPSGEESARCVDRLVTSLGLPFSDCRVADGSGLSLYNYLTPEVLVAALRYAYQNSEIYAHLKPALPVAGCDGTLRRRMTTGNACANVFAKTGTVEGVSTLAGYAAAANGHLLCFAIMNQGVLSQAPARRFQDSVCEALTSP